MLRGSTRVGERWLTTTVLAPAKLNLVLAVGGRRPDGYHEVVSVMQAIDLCDSLQVAVELVEPGRPRASHRAMRVEVDAPGLDGGDTLVTRALEALGLRAGVRLHARVQLDKQIPAGAGLGGGSSDAAAALRAVNDLLGLVDDAALVGVAAMVGSDVPFFLGDSGSAVLTGRGEVMHELPALPPARWVVAWPGTHRSTAAVYRRYRPGPTGLPSRSEAVADATAARFRNDLEQASCEGDPPMMELMMALQDAGGRPFVCGSGSAVAVLVAGGEEAEQHLCDAARSAGAPFVAVARSCDRTGTAYPQAVGEPGLRPGER